jgi:hypothetical protein
MKHGEKFRGSTHVPRKIRTTYKAQNKHRFASRNPKFRDKGNKFKPVRNKQGRQKTVRRVNKNPFKRRVAKTPLNNRKAGKTIVKNTPRKVAKNNKQVQKRLNAANKNLPKIRQGNKQKTNRFVKANTGKRKESLNKARRSFQQPSKKLAQKRQKVQKSSSVSRGKSSQKFSAKRQSQPNRNRIAMNTNSGTRVLSQRSGKTHMEKRSNNTDRMSNSYARPARQQRSRQNSTGRMQSNVARGRRW